MKTFQEFCDTDELNESFNVSDLAKKNIGREGQPFMTPDGKEAKGTIVVQALHRQVVVWMPTRKRIVVYDEMSKSGVIVVELDTKSLRLLK